MTADNDSACTLLVQGARVDGAETDILVAGARIAAIERHDPGRVVPPGARVVSGHRTAALPGLANAHTHTAMAMLRSYADDMPLLPWLQEKIWPFEALLTPDDVYWGARLGCLEMLRTGTTFFNDMYWHPEATARAVVDSGMRALLAAPLLDLGDPDRRSAQIDAVSQAREQWDQFGDRVRFALGPHAVYSASRPLLEWVSEQSALHGILVNIHMSETLREVAECEQVHGLRPPAYLEALGLLSDRLMVAHAVHLDDVEIRMLGEHGVHVLHNPVSNLKLASGGPMRYSAMKSAGVNVLVGTDGAASNNNLDLLEELKFAALMAKHSTGDPTALPAHEALDLVTAHASAAFRLDIGRLAVGALADLILIDLDHPMMFPGHDLAADLIYSAAGRAVTTTICDGQVLMERGAVADEDVIRHEVRRRLARLKG